jgi:pseudaminic acid synthase
MKNSPSRCIEIGNSGIGAGQPVYFVAEMSANHNRDLEQAIRIVDAAKDAGANAIKLQMYTPDTLTIDCGSPHFQIQGTPWSGQTLYDLYSQACMPWDWYPRLKEAADDLEMDLFATAFDGTAVEFLEEMGAPAFKIASFEIVDLPLLRMVARTGKPIILSTGMATLAEIDEAVRTVRASGCDQLALMKCTSAYPSQPEDMNLRAISHLADTYNLPVGLSDHTTELATPIAAVCLGASLVEKHLTLSRSEPGPDSAFSLEPHEFERMVEEVRKAESAVGEVCYGVGDREAGSRVFRRSLFVVKDVKLGEPYSRDNVRSIRPGNGLHTRYLADVIGRRAVRDVRRGTPLSWDLVNGA